VSSTLPTNLIQLTASDLPNAMEVLSAAFLQDPLMSFIFGWDPETRRAGIRALLEMTCRIRLELQESLVGIESGGRLAAVACIAHPEKRPWPASLEAAWEEFEDVIGHDAAARLGRYGGLHERHDMTEPHHYLVALGVHPDFKGQGFGSKLVDYATSLAEADPESIGLCLDTGNTVNLSFYQRHGLKVKASEWLDDLQIFFLFRPNEQIAALIPTPRS
jgi:ribosomal protein S18 acetylase RimI-like enzyme